VAETAWREKISRVASTTPESAQKQLDAVSHLADLRAREAQLADELGNRDRLAFDDNCDNCRSNRDVLECGALCEELANVRQDIGMCQSDVTAADATEALREAREVDLRRDEMARRSARWDKTRANDADVARLTGGRVVGCVRCPGRGVRCSA
jgi:hypothetical protein